MLAAAHRFLVEQQGSDGHWRDFLTLAGEATDWTTAWVALGLVSSDEPALAPALAAAARALVADQQADGGWGYHRGVPTDADSTACALAFLVHRGADHAPASVLERAADGLCAHQGPSGGFSTYARPEPIRRYLGLPDAISVDGWCSPHVEVTALAGWALARAGRASEAERAWRFLADRQRPDGAWGSYWWTSLHYPTAQGARLAAVAGDRAAALRAARWAGEQIAHESTTASPLWTALTLATLAEAGEPDGEAARAARRALAASQLADGSWPSQPSLCIPPPSFVEPAGHGPWRVDALGTGVAVRDHHRTFTTAACVAALASR